MIVAVKKMLLRRINTTAAEGKARHKLRNTANNLLGRSAEILQSTFKLGNAGYHGLHK